MPVFVRPPSTKPPAYTGPLDGTHEEIEGIQQQFEDIELRLSSLESSVNRLRKDLESVKWGQPQLEAPGSPKQEVSVPDENRGDAVPEFTVVQVKLGWLSGPIDRDDDGIDDGLHLLPRQAPLGVADVILVVILRDVELEIGLPRPVHRNRHVEVDLFAALVVIGVNDPVAPSGRHL